MKFLWEPTYHTASYLIDPLASFYPGDAYVVWLGLDGYNWGQYGLEAFWVSFTSPTELFQYTYNEMISTTFSAKPVMVVETASAEGALSTDKAAWITQLQNDATLFPNLKALAYYDGYGNDGTLNGGQEPLSFLAVRRRSVQPGRFQGTFRRHQMAKRPAVGVHRACIDSKPGRCGVSPQII